MNSSTKTSKPKIRGIIFDMDGVLVDAREWHYVAFNKALALFGLEISRYEHLVTYDGLPTKKKLEMLSTERALPKGLHTFLNKMKQQFTMQLVHSNCHPVFAHEYALSKIRSSGIKIAVASNSVRDTVEVVMRKTALISYLDFFLSNEDVKSPKPDPEIYITAIGQLGISPSECLIVEDNQNGLIAARASGAWVMRVDDPSDVNYTNIHEKINEIEGDKA